jgi:hypothetical protein
MGGHPNTSSASIPRGRKGLGLALWYLMADSDSTLVMQVVGAKVWLSEDGGYNDLSKGAAK